MKRNSVFTWLGLLICTVPALGQSTAFSYQGRLEDAGAPAEGPHDLRFRLFDAATGGVQVGSTMCLDNVNLNNGLFTVQLDFGQQFVTTASRHLEIELRRDTGLNCSDTSGFTLLAPRQLLTATPLANHAKSAFALDAADGSPANAVIVDNDGRIGIGTTTPGHSVTIANPAPTLALQDTNSTTQQVGYISFRDSLNVEQAWAGYGTPGDPDFSIVTVRPGGDIVLSTLGGGRVGIGTASPAAALDVHGDIRLGASGQFRAVAGEENLRIIRGTVSAAGVILQGSGFTVSQGSTGHYTITFSSAFSATPTVTATTEGVAITNIMIRINGVSAGSANLETHLNGGFSNNPFHFIAVGPR